MVSAIALVDRDFDAKGGEVDEQYERATLELEELSYDDSIRRSMHISLTFIKLDSKGGGEMVIGKMVDLHMILDDASNTENACT